MANLRIQNLTNSFEDQHIIKGVNLDIEDKEFAVLVGPSGCGKSTLLRLIAGLEDVSSGEIILGEKEITYEKPSRRDLAMVFQSYALYPHMTVRKTWLLGLNWLVRIHSSSKVRWSKQQNS